MRCDVAFDDQVEHLRHEVLEEFGRVDIVMNNAGVAILGPPETISMEDWDWILQVNLFGVIRGVRAFLPHMIERGSGHIVNTASLAGLFAYNWDTIPYITGKFGVVGLTEASRSTRSRMASACRSCARGSSRRTSASRHASRASPTARSG